MFPSDTATEVAQNTHTDADPVETASNADPVSTQSKEKAPLVPVLHGLERRDIAINELDVVENNPRKYSKKLIQNITNSLHEFGFIVPILIDGKNRVISGHARVHAAVKLDMDKVPAILVDHLTEAQIRAFRIADNQIASNPQWDMAALAEELTFILETPELDVSITGFETAQVDKIIMGIAAKETLAEDDTPEPDTKNPARVKVGDLWQLGEHKLFCGNSMLVASYDALLGDELAHTVFTDPPYNVPINGHVRTKDTTDHREFAMASGEMSPKEFRFFLETACRRMEQYSHEGSLHYICMDWAHLGDLLPAGDAVYTTLKNICVWNKDNAGMGSLYRSKHEMIAVYKKGYTSHVNNIALGKYGRYRTNVWDYAGANSRSNPNRKSDLDDHPTVKPCAMVADAILDCTKRNQIVLDPFAGSGTTLIAAEKTRRIARCIEIDPHYCDIILKRWEKLTGQEAVCLNAETTGEGK